MSLPFQLAGGSVLGREHVRTKKNNADAFFISYEATLDTLIGVVTDGCSQGKFNEVGAHIGCRFVAKLIGENLRRFYSRGSLGSIIQDEIFWHKVKGDLQAKLHNLALDMGEGLSTVVLNYLLFTIVGVVITPQETVFFSIGDGVFIVNGTVFPLGPFPDNVPPYLAYSLLDPRAIPAIPQSLLEFQLLPSIQTKDLFSFVLGTDGVMSLLHAQEEKIPGQKGLVGDISQFWTDDLYFTNLVALERRLRVINGYTQPYEGIALTFHNDKITKREPGHLPDDTTLIVGRQTF